MLIALCEAYLRFRRPIARRLSKYLVREAAFEDSVYRARWVFYIALIIDSGLYSSIYFLSIIKLLHSVKRSPI